MYSDPKNIHLLIAHKLQELKTLKEEWREASLYPEYTDYEYLAVLYPIIAETEREAGRFMKLATAEYSGEQYFPVYIRQLLNNECHSLEVHIEMARDAYVDFKGPLMVFERMKQKYAISATLLQHGPLKGFLHDHRPLNKLGWKRNGKDAFRLKHVIRNDDDLNEFYRLIACTFMEPLAYLMKSAKEQHFVVIPLPAQ